MPKSGDWGTDEITRLRPRPEPPPRRRGRTVGGQPRPAAPGPGDVLKRRYTLIRRIGVGGMGEVFEASHRALPWTLAVKVLLADLWEPGATGAAARFVREAKAASTLSHDNIVKTLDVGRTKAGLPYIVMEYLRGQDLGTILGSGPLPWSRVRRLFEQLLGALDHAHERGVVHRDLKPENCLIVGSGTPDEQLKLVDFGIARVLDDANADKLTRTGTIVGTPHYMSPEQALGKDVGPASDVYSAGVLLFELLTGLLPFDSGTPLQIASQHITQTPPRISEVAPNLQLPSHVETAVDVALQKDPADRHAGAKAFARAIAGPVTAPAPAPPLLAPEPTVEPASEPTSGSKPTRSKRTLRILLGAAFLVPLAVFAGYGSQMLRGDTASPTPAIAEADAEPPSTSPVQAGVATPDPPAEPVLDVGARPSDVGASGGAAEPLEPVEPIEPAEADERGAVDASARADRRPDAPPRKERSTDARADAKPSDSDAPADPPTSDDPLAPIDPPTTDAEKPAPLPKRLSESRIRRGLQRRLKECDQAGASRVRLDLSIGAQGTAERVRVLPPYTHSPVADCIVRALDGANFGKAQFATTFSGRVEVGRSDSSEGGAG